MYFAQLDKNDNNCIVCFVKEEIVMDDSIKFYSENEDEVKNFCENWNAVVK